jgi:hypothetical protein
MLFELKKFSQLMLSKPKKFSRPTIILIYFFGILLIVYTLRPLFWTGGTGISDTLDKIFWGDTKRSETVVSKTVETDKQGNTVKTIETIKYDDGKTLWDWGSLLIVPSSLLLFGYILQLQQQERAANLSKEQQKRAEDFSKEQQERAEKFANEQRDIADNETKEEILQTYFDRLSVLLIDRNLIVLSNKSNLSTITPEEQELLDSALDVIRARTLSILRRFEKDAERKASVINFLIETEIVGKSNLNLSGAKLEGVFLFEAYLPLANLGEANLRWALLTRANLGKANLKEAILAGAILNGANLSGANLSGAYLIRVSIERANLAEANLEGAYLAEASLKGANLEGAKLNRADLKDIKWDSKTIWPDKSQFDNATNIPEELKKELGITP